MKQLFQKSLLIISFIISFINASSQTPTVGLIYNDTDATEGYMLFSPEINKSVYLINNCGEKINEWTFSELPALTCYFLENGNLLRAGQDSLEIRDWNNNLIWSYALTANGIRAHHDIEPLPNGNILLVVRDIYNKAQMIEAGKDTNTVKQNTQLDKIVELEPSGTNDATIVWEWKIMDHLVQDFDSTKNNYGVINDHPELIDINYESFDDIDWSHANSVDYNAGLDQILITIRHLSEIIIVDHSTTGKESQGKSVGRYGRGGDILWRWGNVNVYRKGESNQQKLFMPHDAQWVKAGYPDEGKITVFNNGDGETQPFSSIHIVDPELTDSGYTINNGIFLPDDFEWSWSGLILGDTVFERNKSGVQQLQSGNLLMCETSIGRVSELTKSGELLWTYVNPSGMSIFNQYEIITPLSGVTIYRGEKYPADYPGFYGLDLSPQGIIENENPVSDSCIAIVGVENDVADNLKIINPVVNNRLEFSENVSINSIAIYDITGKLIFKKDNFRGNNIPVYLKQSVYILQFTTKNKVYNRKIVVQ